MSLDHSDEVGWPAEATTVHATDTRPNPDARKAELFPCRFDPEPRVTEQKPRSLVDRSWEDLLEERRLRG